MRIDIDLITKNSEQIKFKDEIQEKRAGFFRVNNDLIIENF
jgi:hypothetical protein